MSSILLIVVTFVGYIIAYRLYGRFLARKIFKLDDNNLTPAHELRDDIDYVPTKKEILFGHHYTSIAGLGPIVGPTIAVIWGWVPAILWVFFGSIFMGAVHDMGSLVISMRNKGKSIGDIVSSFISPRVRLLFLLIIFFELWLVIAVFALVIAVLFNLYPQAVIPIWVEVPIAMLLGYAIYKKNFSHVWGAIIAVVLLYVFITIGAYFPVSLPYDKATNISIWSVILFVYAFFAAILPVWVLLQPRDYINGHEIYIMLALLLIGVFVAHPNIVAPAYTAGPKGAPSMFPFLFVIIACGAISGFHSLVSSGTTSKQIDKESDALTIGYGGMLMEAVLATLVIIAVAAGLGMGFGDKIGLPAWQHFYGDWATIKTLKLKAFVEGAVNLIASIGIPKNIAATIMTVFIVSYAGTTLDTATRLQRYVVSELTYDTPLKILSNKYVATFIAVAMGALIVFVHSQKKSLVMVLWPLFGAVNQLLAGLALLAITAYLIYKKQKTIYASIPMVFMLFMTGWAMFGNMVNFYNKGNWLLFGIDVAVVILEVWMIMETALLLIKRNSTVEQV